MADPTINTQDDSLLMGDSPSFSSSEMDYYSLKFYETDSERLNTSCQKSTKLIARYCLNDLPILGLIFSDKRSSWNRKRKLFYLVLFLLATIVTSVVLYLFWEASTRCHQRCQEDWDSYAAHERSQNLTLNSAMNGMCTLFNSKFQGAEDENNLFCYPSFVLDSSGNPFPPNLMSDNWEDCKEEAERKQKSFNLCRVCPQNFSTSLTTRRTAGTLADCDFCRQNLSYTHTDAKTQKPVYPSMLVCQRITWSETIKDRAAADPTNYALQIVWQCLLIFVITNLYLKFFVYLTVPNAYLGLWPIARAVIGYSVIIVTTLLIMVFGALMLMEMNNGHYSLMTLAAHEAIVISVLLFLEGAVVVFLTSIQIGKLQRKEWQVMEDVSVNGEPTADAGVVTEGEEDNIIGLLEGGRIDKYYYELVQTDLFSLIFEYITYRKTGKRRFYGT